ncbi:MAG: guanylate kinase [Gammaproteobacteria bacterium]|nr:guanylate kinase [Gammaproteobacteria bacterium]
MSTGTLYIISGPSGVGKTSLVRTLVDCFPELKLSISFTTRKIRPGEQQGVDYHFCSPTEFAEMDARGDFLESAEVFGNRYGTSRRWVGECLAQGHDVLLEIDWQGAAQARAAFPEAISILVVPPALEVLRARLKSRKQDDDSEIDRRLAEAAAEISHYRDFDYLLVNAEFDQAAAELKAIYTVGQLRVKPQARLLNRQMPEIFASD